MKISNLGDLKKIKDSKRKEIFSDRPRISVGMGTCGLGNGADAVYKTLEQAIKRRKLNIGIVKVGCFGFCAEEPLVNIYLPGKPLVILHKVTASDVSDIINKVLKNDVPKGKALCKIEEWDHITDKVSYGRGFDDIPVWNKVPFFEFQKKIVLRDCGLIDPDDIEEYIAVGGYEALGKALTGLSPEKVIEEVKLSNLRGRGGAGFPTWRKWEIFRRQNADQKYVVCNADEGDPGAYMNRNEIESDPHMLIEGMIIGAYAMGATRGVVYIRAEYPLAVERLKSAIEEARRYGFLGNKIFGTNFNFDIDVVEGAGAFVCGEETALIASLEGKAGRPWPRPPFPAEKGFRGKPTNINNVETWCNVSAIIVKGSAWFSETGTKETAGTKVFSLVGKVKNTGLVELAFGSPLESIVYEMGEGAGKGKKIKSVQTGGPSGGCIPSQLFKTAVDYETLANLGSIMGSGGMVVMDEDNCMVDVARYFIEFTASESCGKCTPCREGLQQALKIIRDITEGKGKEGDLAILEALGRAIKDTAICGLGQTAPNPVLTTLRYFKDEYEDHIIGKRCNAGVCQELFISPCENSCPLHINISGFLTLLKEKRLKEAYELVLRENPLPASTGRICHFYCKTRCRRQDIDESISPGEVHRFIADTIYKKKDEKEIVARLLRERLSATGKKIAIVGAGPAGLTAAFYLTRLGHKVTIYEATSKAGGVLRWGIPAHRLPKDVLERETRLIKDLGVKFLFKTKVTDLKHLDKEYDAVFLATGAQKETSLDMPGQYLKGVLSGVKLLEEVAEGKKPHLGRKVTVIGGGNVAIDAARTALRLGSDVTIVYRREKADMPANEGEIREAEAEGIKFMFFSAPQSAVGEKGKVKALQIMKMKAGDFDNSGRKRPVPTGEKRLIDCDTIIVAIGEKADSEFISKFGIEARDNGTVKANRFTFKTNNPKFYAGGDLVSGPATAVEAMAAGKKAAEEIDLQLTGEKRFDKMFRKFVYGDTVPFEPKPVKPRIRRHLPVKSRKNNFKEVSLGLTGAEAMMEAERCLRCDVKETIK